MTPELAGESSRARQYMLCVCVRVCVRARVYVSVCVFMYICIDVKIHRPFCDHRGGNVLLDTGGWAARVREKEQRQTGAAKSRDARDAAAGLRRTGARASARAPRRDRGVTRTTPRRRSTSAPSR